MSLQTVNRRYCRKIFNVSVTTMLGFIALMIASEGVLYQCKQALHHVNLAEMVWYSRPGIEADCLLPIFNSTNSYSSSENHHPYLEWHRQVGSHLHFPLLGVELLRPPLSISSTVHPKEERADAFTRPVDSERPENLSCPLGTSSSLGLSSLGLGAETPAVGRILYTGLSQTIYTRKLYLETQPRHGAECRSCLLTHESDISPVSPCGDF